MPDHQLENVTQVFNVNDEAEDQQPKQRLGRNLSQDVARQNPHGLRRVEMFRRNGLYVVTFQFPIAKSNLMLAWSSSARKADARQGRSLKEGVQVRQCFSS